MEETATGRRQKSEGKSKKLLSSQSQKKKPLSSKKSWDGWEKNVLHKSSPIEK